MLDIKDSNFFFQPAWVFMVIFTGIAIAGNGYAFYRSRMQMLFKALFTFRFANQLSREEYILTHPMSILLSANFLLISSLFILQSALSFELFNSLLDFSFLSLLLIIASLFLVYAVKIVVLKMIGVILKKEELTNEYIFHVFLINQALGLLLIPVVITASYGGQPNSSAVIFSGIFMAILSFIYRIGKGMISLLSKKGVSLSYLFLYLCTLEILPLLLGIKLLGMLA